MTKNSKKETSNHNVVLGYHETYIKAAKDRNIFLSEDITKESAAQLVAMLLHYDNIDHEDIITIYINSNGGDVSGLSCIYDTMQMINAPIRTICMGKAYSAGAVLLAAGSVGERYAFERSQIMIHGIQCIFPMPGLDISNNKNYFSFLKENNDNIMKILANHTNKSLKKIKDDCKEDCYMTASEALKYGIIDEII